MKLTPQQPCTVEKQKDWTVAKGSNTMKGVLFFWCVFNIEDGEVQDAERGKIMEKCFQERQIS